MALSDKINAMLTGYSHPQYAQSLAEFGTPLQLKKSGGSVLIRKIYGSPYYDAMGCYPLFTCRDWSKLPMDLEAMGEGESLVTISMVLDPFGDYDTTYLTKYFKDCFIPFKEHFVVRLDSPPEKFVSDHHRRNARKAFEKVYVEKCENPMLFLDDWTKLYTNLIAKHNIKGISEFSRISFEKQLSIPGIQAFRAVCEGETIGMLLWYLQGEVAYYHLGAYNSIGYETGASFALFWFGIECFFKSGVRWLNLGAGAGTTRNNMSGLSRFKQGWSNETRITYFCGRIFDKKIYCEIIGSKNITGIDYFPAYRNDWKV